MKTHTSTNAAEDEESSDHSIHHRLASPVPLPLSTTASALSNSAICQALLEYQVHHWYHCRSCFKASRRTPSGKICRMFFPKEPIAATKWTSHDKVALRRDIGSEYLNTYVPLINSVFKCNHDVKFLTAAEGPEKAFYMMKYTTKDQNTIENPLAIHLHAYDKAQLKSAQAGDAASAGRRCVQSMCCSLSNAQEVSAPLAALYLERGSPFFSSVEFENLHVASCTNAIFKNAAVDVSLTQSRGSTFVASSIFLDYIYRPEPLGVRTLMEFVRLYEKKPNRVGLHFISPHAQRTTHSVHLRVAPVVPCLLGKRLPDMRDPNVDAATKEDFQRAMMTLFRPFRHYEDFGFDPRISADAQFQTWWRDIAPPEAHRFLIYSNDYYNSRELARQRVDEETQRYMNCVDGVSCDGYVSDSDSSSEGGLEQSIAEGDFWDDTAVLNSTIMHTSQITAAMDAASLAAASQRTPLASESVLYDSVTTEQVQRAIADAEKAFAARERSPLAKRLHQPVDMFPTRVQLLAEALSNAQSWKNPDSLLSPCDLSLNASLISVSSHFCLNQKQHKAFIRLGGHFLQSILSDSHDTIEQVIAFLGGAPGTGKSQVIRALQTLAASWNSADAIRTVAYQGVAAEAANGQTIHNLFKWGIDNGSRTKRYSIQDKEEFASLKLLIMDEVSTTDASIIGMMDIALRELKNEPDKRFGGIHVLSAGDWLQQLPVAGHPAFVAQPPPPTLRRNSDETRVYLLRQRGIDTYREVNAVVMLQVDMRHRDDPIWRDILARWRHGDYRQDDIDLVNHQCCNTNWRSSSATTTKAFCPILVTSNALRVEFNKLATEAYCKKTSQILHYFPACVSRRRGQLTPGQRRSLSCIRSDKTKGLPMVMTLAIGLPMQCTKNISRALHLANGTIGSVVGFRVACDDRVRVDNAGGYQAHFHTKPADIVYLQLHERTLLLSTIVGCTPPGISPVCHRKESGVKISIQDRAFSVVVDQVPLVPAFALTTEKCQGLTVTKAVIGPLRHQTRRQPQRSSFYVAVTRVKSMQNLFLMELLTLEFLQYFTPSEAALTETLRLQRLEQDCDRRQSANL